MSEGSLLGDLRHSSMSVLIIYVATLAWVMLGLLNVANLLKVNGVFANLSNPEEWTKGVERIRQVEV